MVVVIALVGGAVSAVLSAVAAALLINYFFVDPLHTLDIADPDQAVALVVFVVVARSSAAPSRSPTGGPRPPSGREPRPRRSPP